MRLSESQWDVSYFINLCNAPQLCFPCYITNDLIQTIIKVFWSFFVMFFVLQYSNRTNVQTHRQQEVQHCETQVSQVLSI